MNKPKIIAIVGCTGAGKTAMGIEIAKRFDGEVISADSRTVYCQMDIGTAKPKLDADGRVEGVLHHGFDIVKPDEHFHARDFQKFAQEKINEILSRGKLPVLVGGTGLYISGVIDNFDFEGGIAGEPLYDVLQIAPYVDRKELYKRIDARVDEMIVNDLEGEVRRLKEKYGCSIKAMTGIGYRQMCEYIDGRITREKAIELIKRDSRRYAKRQITWFKHDRRIVWVRSVEEAIDCVKKFLA